MSFGSPTLSESSESSERPDVMIEAGYEDFVPADFLDDPLRYFDGKGVNVKSGEIEYKEDGRISEDPTAVKDLPVWKDEEGRELQVVAKRVNKEKGGAKLFSDPFHEYEIMKEVRRRGLPAAAPILKAEQGNDSLFVMERVEGFRWNNKTVSELLLKGFSDADIRKLKDQGLKAVRDLRKKFEDAGILRKWKPADVIFQIDLDKKEITGAVPVDWERATVSDK